MTGERVTVGNGATVESGDGGDDGGGGEGAGDGGDTKIEGRGEFDNEFDVNIDGTVRSGSAGEGDSTANNGTTSIKGNCVRLGCNNKMGDGKDRTKIKAKNDLKGEPNFSVNTNHFESSAVASIDFSGLVAGSITASEGILLCSAIIDLRGVPAGTNALMAGAASSIVVAADSILLDPGVSIEDISDPDATTDLPSSETDCANGIDDDCDGKTDCSDSDCADTMNCASVPTLSEWGLALMTLLILVGGTVVIRGPFNGVAAGSC